MDRDVLSTIPGELLSAALHSLPDAASSEENTLQIVVELPDGIRAEVTFARLKRPYRKDAANRRALVLDSGQRGARRMKLKEYNRAVCLLLNVFDPRVPCKYGCKWIAPYGWVRNRSCRWH